MPLTILEAIQERRHGDYWANRARQNQRRADKIASELLKREKQLYNEMYKKLEALIAEVQSEVLFNGGVASRTQLWQYAKYQQLEKELRDMTQTTIQRQKTLMDEGMERVFEETIETSMTKVAGRSAGFNVVPSGTAKKYINTAWAGDNYSTRIWKNMNALASHLKDDMADMIVLGRSPADIRRKLREDFNVGFYEADRLARTEANHVYNSAAIEGYRRNGVKKVNILIGRKEGTCSRCHKYADHGEYPIDEAPTLPAHPNCGCCYTPVVDWDDWGDEDEENAGLTGGGEDGIMSTSDVPILRSLGAKSIISDEPVYVPGSEQPAFFVPGTRIQNVEVFAGKGTQTPIRERFSLEKGYPGSNADDWEKAKGIGWVEHMGEEHKAEVHWYYENHVGGVEYKIKRKNGGFG